MLLSHPHNFVGNPHNFSDIFKSMCKNCSFEMRKGRVGAGKQVLTKKGQKGRVVGQGRFSNAKVGPGLLQIDQKILK